ncbi:2-hydroxycyclohexanecarboxyl-CoA dehydrogenase [Microbacterium hydrothermale]|uniref:SDR family NAD(P)-dependent oxidoreductase n=1 Tax=Microbacterium TaxID=33882 RepID=UPI0022276BCD|nr:SDR family oxidoreductase [Microbacterium hydrothermale]MCW2163203.1 2-hydroxycyclohexanecarboxyl-CoA dehydrogenase [Microbacterium hydrothermale]
MSQPTTAVVTGAGSPRGIGRATARALAATGAPVAVIDLDAAAAEAVAAELRDEFGVEAFGYGADVTDEAAVDAVVARIESDLPPVASLANIAGITSPTRFLQTTLAEWNRVMSINATGTYIVTKRIAAGMVERGYGRIVNMSSVSAIRGGGVFGGVPYSAAKAAILGFTRAVARELGPSGVTVNSVTPGVVATDIRAGATNDELEAKLAADVPLGRQATAEDIANLFEFLMSDRSAYITGATYDINGGSHIS